MKMKSFKVLLLISLAILSSKIFSQAIFYGVSGTFTIAEQQYEPLPEMSATSGILDLNAKGEYITAYSNLFVLNTNNVQPNWGSISGVITDLNTGAVLPNANVVLSGLFGSNPVSAFTVGNYELNTTFGYGYNLDVYANGYIPQSYSGINVTQLNPDVILDFQLQPNLGTYLVTTSNSNPNPSVSTVAPGGKLHRYYWIKDPVTEIPAAGSLVTVSVNNYDKLFTANIFGIVDVEIESSEIGNGQPGASASFSITAVNGSTLLSPITFNCEVENPYSETYFSTAKEAGFGFGLGLIGLNIGANGETITNGSNIFISNDDNPFDFENVGYDNYSYAAAGLSKGVGVKVYLEWGGSSSGGGATASASANLVGISEDKYVFGSQFNENEALVQYALWGEGNFGAIDQTLIRLLHISKQEYQNSIYPLILNNAITSEDRSYGFGVKGKAEAGIDFPLISSLGVFDVDFGVSAVTGGKLTAGYDKINQEGYLCLSAYVESAGEFANNFIPYSSAFDFINLDLNLNSYTGGAGWELKVILDLNGDASRIEYSLYTRGISNNSGIESKTNYTITSSSIISSFLSSVSEIGDLINSIQNINSNTVTLQPSVVSNVIDNFFAPSYCTNEYISYQTEKRIIDNYDIDTKRDIEIAGLPISFGLSQKTIYEKGKFYIKEEGILYNGRMLPLKENIEPDFINQDFLDYITDIIQTMPISVQGQFGIQNKIGLNILTKSSSWYLDSLGSNISFDTISTSFPVDSFSCTYWNWEGQLPGSKKSMTKSEKEIMNAIKSQAFASFGMDYGIGGFYHFEPYDTIFTDTALLSIMYPDSDVIGINEAGLAMYYEDRTNHKWVYVGGIVDTVNNSVTAPINRFALYTLAPAMPYGSFSLFASPDTIFADSISVSVISSNTIRNNDSTVVEDGQLFTVNTYLGSIITQDVDTSVDGLQVAALNGIIQFSLKSSHVSGLAEVSVKSIIGSATAGDTVVFIDTIPPEIPVNLTAQADNGKVLLNWNPVNEDDLAGYVIYFDTDTTIPPYNGISTVWGRPSPIFVAVDSNYTVLGLFNDTLYHFAITAIDISGNESAYSNIANATPYFDSVNYGTQEISLPITWSMFSTYIDPINSGIDSVLSEIEQNVIIVKNGQGQTYWPQFSINLIGELKIGEGYQVKMLNADTIIIGGELIEPETAPIEVPAGWSYLGYLRTSSAPVDSLMLEIVNEIIVVKDYLGFIYWPQFSINTIGSFKPGEGYQIKMLSADTLIYPANEINFSKVQSTKLKNSYYKHSTNTGNNMTLGLPLNSWQEFPKVGDEIGIFDNHGLLVGSGVFNDENIAISIWGKDATSNSKYGLNYNEEFILKLWSNKFQTEKIIKIESWIEGDDKYLKDKIAVASSVKIIEPEESVVLYQNTPNPFSKKTGFRFFLPEQTIVEFSILNQKGEILETLISEEMNSGEHRLQYKTKHHSPGTYYYKLKTPDFEKTRKMVILKP